MYQHLIKCFQVFFFRLDLCWSSFDKMFLRDKLCTGMHAGWIMLWAKLCRVMHECYIMLRSNLCRDMHEGCIMVSANGCKDMHECCIMIRANLCRDMREGWIMLWANLYRDMHERCVMPWANFAGILVEIGCWVLPRIRTIVTVHGQYDIYKSTWVYKLRSISQKWVRSLWLINDGKTIATYEMIMVK